MSDSREALAHQRLAARLLALRTQQLENKLSQVTDDYTTSDNTGSPHDVGQMKDKISPLSDDCVASNARKMAENKFSQVSVNYVTPGGSGSHQEGCYVEDKLSPVLDYCVTCNESEKVEKLLQVSDNCVTTSGVSSLQESDDVGDKFSLMSNNYVTVADVNHIKETNAVEALQTEKSSEFQSGVSDDTTREIASS